MNKQERELRYELIRKALTTDDAIAAAVELVDAHLANDDCNDDDAAERENDAVRSLVKALGYEIDE